MLPRRTHANDFAHYYVTSRLWIEGRNPYRADFRAEFARFGFEYDERIGRAGNAPPLILLFSPFARLSPPEAFWSWACLEAVALLVTLLFISHLAGRRFPPAVTPIVLAALVASNATFYHFVYSQVQLLVGALLLGAYWMQRHRRYSHAWLCVMAASTLKLFPASVLPWFVFTAPGSLRQKVKWLVPGAVFVAVVWLSTRSLWFDFVTYGIPVVTANVANRTFDYSVPSFVVNVAASAFDFNLAPSTMRSVWRLASLFGALLILFTYCVCWRNRTDHENGFCAQILASLLASPTAWGHYFVLVMYPFVVFAAVMFGKLSPRRLIATAVMYLFVLELFDAQQLAPIGTVARVLVAYGPMYASLALYAWYVRRVLKPQAAVGAPA